MKVNSPRSIASGLFRRAVLILNPVSAMCRRYVADQLKRLYPDRSVAPTVLDFGSGVSPYKRVLERRLPKANYIAIDLERSDETSVVADIAKVPLRDTCADIIFCFDVLQHVDFSSAVLAEMHRVLRPGGHCLMTVPFLYAECDVRDFRRWTLEGISRDVERAGFKIVDCRPRGGVFFLVPILVSSFVALIFPRPTAWRGSATRFGVLRSLTISVVVLPFQVLAWAGLLLDRVLPLRGAYMGSMILFSKPYGD